MKKIFYMVLLAAVLTLSGCSLRTVDELYCPPKRSESYVNLQNLIDDAMEGFVYSAPSSGVNLQTVQMADLNGDGGEEYLLFAKGSSEQPMHIFIFSEGEDGYFLMDTIHCSGSSFGRVEYAQMDGRPGVELIVGRRIGDQISSALSVYTLRNGEMEQLLTTQYTQYLCTDLDGNRMKELFVLRPEDTTAGAGVAEMFYVSDGTMTRSAEVPMSRPADSVKRIMVSRLDNSIPAVYVASDVDGEALVTDVFTRVDNKLTNITISNDSNTNVDTLRNYYVYAEDIDQDGVLELPQLIKMKLPYDYGYSESQHLIHWYALTSSGEQVTKRYTYHNYVGGWYLQLDASCVPYLTVLHHGSSHEFYLWNDDRTELEPLMTIYSLTGQRREELAAIDNRFVLYRTESTVYAASLEVTSVQYGMTRQGLIDSFAMIQHRWDTEES